MSAYKSKTQIETVTGQLTLSPQVNIDIQPNIHAQKEEKLCQKLVKTARESNGASDFCTAVIRHHASPGLVYLWLCLSFCYALVVIIWNVSMIVMGAIGVESCSFQPMLPIYLIVCGGVGCFGSCCLAASNSDDNAEQSGDDCSLGSLVQTLVRLFLLAWLVFGCIWIFPIRNSINFQDQRSKDYCDPGLFNFAFYSVCVQLAIVALLLLPSIILFLCVCVLSRKNTENGN